MIKQKLTLKQAREKITELETELERVRKLFDEEMEITRHCMQHDAQYINSLQIKLQKAIDLQMKEGDEYAAASKLPHPHNIATRIALERRAVECYARAEAIRKL